MFILPLANESKPLDTNNFSIMDKDYALEIKWETSSPVKLYEKPDPKKRDFNHEFEDNFHQLREMLKFIESEDYDTWIKIGAAIHHHTNGSYDGMLIWDEWSSKAHNYADYEDIEYKWDSFQDTNSKPATIKTVEYLARRNGWVPQIKFDDLSYYDAEPPKFELDSKGRLLALVNNIVLALKRPDICGYYIAKDNFKEQVMLKPYTAKSEKWEGLQDTDHTKLRMILEAKIGFKPIPTHMIRECVMLVAKENCFDSASDWLNSLKWDDKPRVEKFLSTHIGVKDSAYIRAVSKYLWSAMAGRVIEPGVKADMAGILIGKQGDKKSSAIEALVANDEHYIEIDMSKKEDDKARLTKGRLVGEFGEMRGMHSGKVESMKAYMSRRSDTWTPKYMEQSVTYDRRIIFWGTSNHKDLFSDTTGNRRWLPVEVGKIDLEAIKRDREQLWAEAAGMFLEHSVMYQDAERLSAEVNRDYAIIDPWYENIATWLEEKGLNGKIPLDKGYIRTNEVLLHAVGLTKTQANSGYGKRVSEILTSMGLKKKRKRIDKQLCHVWVKSE